MKVEEPLVSYGIPALLSPAVLMDFMSTELDISESLKTIKNQTGASDQTIAQWMGINVKTFRSLRDQNSELPDHRKEHLVMLLTLSKRGIAALGTAELFAEWLQKENFNFGGNKPSDLLNTNSGIRLVDDRLENLKYGINA